MNPALRRLFEEYADSHRHPMNRLTHKIAIPLIVFHVLVMLDWIKLFEIPGTGVWLSVGHIGAALAVLFYLRLDVKLGLLFIPLFGICFPLGWYLPKLAVVGIAIVAWMIQLAGHYVWEKKSPAFLTNVVQTLIGPLFFVAILTGDWPIRQTETAR